MTASNQHPGGTLNTAVRVLTIEDDPIDFESVRRQLTTKGVQCYQITRAETFTRGLELLSSSHFDIVLLDCRLPDSDGLSSIKKIAQNYPCLPVVVMTGIDDQQLAVESLKHGAQDFMVKGSTNSRLECVIRYAIERQAILERLHLAESEARHAKETERRFLANMSHEIRTPLTAIIGFGESLLNQVSPTSSARNSCEAIVRNGQHLLDLVSDILSYAKIESGQLQVERVPMCLLDIVKAIDATIRRQAESKGLACTIDFQPPVPIAIRSDPLRIRQVLLNLANNAVKFTAQGGVTITLRVDYSQELLICEVSDSGIGISAEDCSKLFKPFTQVDSTIASTYGGTGLGLAISKDLTELLGGSLQMRSIPGQGSTFIATFATGPLQSVPIIDDNTSWPATKISKIETEPTQQLSGKILLVEDCQDNRSLITCLLENSGMSVECANNGSEGLQRAMDGEFDLVLMDVQMPVMNGLEATQILRTRGYEKPIIFLTATMNHEQMREYLNAGGNYCLSKPFRQKELLAALAMYLPRTSDLDPIQPSREVDSADFYRIVERFLSKLPQRLAAIEGTLVSRDFVELRRHAHQLAGAGAFGCDEIGDISAELEKAAISNCFEQCQELLTRLRAVVPESPHNAVERVLYYSNKDRQ